MSDTIDPLRDAIVAAIACVLIVAAALAFAGSARAEMGPCQPDKFDGLTCGSGTGAARIITDTLSPTQELGFAWRNPKAAPTDEQEDETLELLLVRLKDGEVLAKGSTEYWNNGETHANRRTEDVSWSPDGTLAVRAMQLRFDTSAFELYILGHAKPVVIDLLKIVEPAVRAKMKVPKAEADRWVLSVFGRDNLTISNNGIIRFRVTMWVPKEGPEKPFDIVLRLSENSKKQLAVRVTSITAGKDPE